MSDFKIFIYTVFIVVLVLGGTYFVWKKTNSVTQVYERDMRYEITLECQRLAAVRTNETWQYTDCLEELIESLEPEYKLL